MAEPQEKQKRLPKIAGKRRHVSKYMPHQSDREKARRRRQMERAGDKAGWTPFGFEQ